MMKFLLKQMEKLTKQSVKKVTMVFIKPSRFTYPILAIAVTIVMPSAYAGEKLSDAELDTKFIEVQVQPLCIADHGDTKNSNNKGGDIKFDKQSCPIQNGFVTAATKQDGTESNKIESGLAQSSDSQALDSQASASLLAGIFQNMRALGGGGDFLGVPAGVANTGNPVLFGSERYSTKWAGNIGDIFKPIYSGGLIAPYSVYDYSELGYGFRAEAHIPYNIPQPTIQSINRN